MNDQSVEFIIQGYVGSEVALEELADVFVTEPRVGKAVTLQDAAGVGIDDEDRMLRGVEKDGVGGLGTDAADGEQLIAQRWCWNSKHFAERALVVAAEETDEGFQGFCFLAEIA